MNFSPCAGESKLILNSIVNTDVSLGISEKVAKPNALSKTGEINTA